MIIHLLMKNIIQHTNNIMTPSMNFNNLWKNLKIVNLMMNQLDMILILFENYLLL